MSTLNREVMLTQNSALGAMLLWRFTTGYSQGSQSVDATPLPLLFLVLPICLHQETARFAESTLTASGLRTFANKFSESRNAKGDLLFAIHGRTIRMRVLTLSSLQIAIGSKLLLLIPDRAVALPGSITPPRTGIPVITRNMLKVAEKLGNWCAEVSLHEVSAILKVRF